MLRVACLRVCVFACCIFGYQRYSDDRNRHDTARRKDKQVTHIRWSYSGSSSHWKWSTFAACSLFHAACAASSVVMPSSTICFAPKLPSNGRSKSTIIKLMRFFWRERERERRLCSASSLGPNYSVKHHYQTWDNYRQTKTYIFQIDLIQIRWQSVS